MSLTDAAIRALDAPQKGQKLYPDGTLPGFACRVSQGGTKTFLLVVGRDRRKITIGRFPIISLSQARTEAKRLLAEFTLGKVRPQSITYAAALELFLADKAQNRRPATVLDYRRRLERLNFKCQLADITPPEASRKLDRFTAPSERSHILVAAKVFFTWCMKRRYIERNPFYGLSKPRLVPRKRVLTDDELKAIWQATKDPTLPNLLTRLMLVTGQRRGEVEQWRRHFLTGDTLTIPGTITKNHVEQLLPLGPLALELLKTFPDRYTNWGDYKTQLDKLCGVKDWMLRDLRRTFRTNLSKLGVAPHIAERLLHHLSAADPIQLTYDRHTYLEEMRAAMLKHDQFISALCGTSRKRAR